MKRKKVRAVKKRVAKNPKRKTSVIASKRAMQKKRVVSKKVRSSKDGKSITLNFKRPIQLSFRFGRF